MGVSASNLDRLVQFRRATETSDGFGGSSLSWQDHGGPIYAARRDVRDTEAVQAGVYGARLMTRFFVRSDSFTRDLTPADRLAHEGQTFEIKGIKESDQGRRRILEITAEEATV